jgi:hypothetical protein
MACFLYHHLGTYWLQKLERRSRQSGHLALLVGEVDSLSIYIYLSPPTLIRSDQLYILLLSKKKVGACMASLSSQCMHISYYQSINHVVSFSWQTSTTSLKFRIWVGYTSIIYIGILHNYYFQRIFCKVVFCWPDMIYLLYHYTIMEYHTSPPHHLPHQPLQNSPNIFF